MPELNDRLVQITRCVYEIHRCEEELARGGLEIEGILLGYYDWLEELHHYIWEEEVEYRNGTSSLL